MKLYKKKVVYKDKSTGEEKTAVNFSLKLGDALIPIEGNFSPTRKRRKTCNMPHGAQSYWRLPKICPTKSR